MTPIKLFGFAGSTYVRTARLVLAEKGLACELLPLEFGADSHRARHPFLKMPALEHDGVRLFETLAIASYAERLGSGPSLIPSGAREEAVMYQWISAAIDYLYADLVRGLLAESPSEDARRDAVRSLDLLDARLRESDYLAGGELSLADLFVAPMVTFAFAREPKLARDARPGLDRFLKTLSSRVSFRATEA